MVQSRHKTAGLCYFSHMNSISLHSVRNRAGAGMLAVLMLVFGFSLAGAQEAKPAPPPAPAEAKDKDKAADKEAPLPAGRACGRRAFNSMANRSTTR